MAEPTFAELAEIFEDAAKDVAAAATIDEIKAALVPALAAYAKRMRGREADHR